MHWILANCFRKACPAFFALLLFPGFSRAQSGVHFREAPLSAALQEAKQSGKDVFLFGYATWCPHCQRMHEQVFSDTAVGRFFNAHFVCIHEDFETGEGKQLHDQFLIHGYPALLFLDAQGNLLYQLANEYPAAELLEEAKNALTPTLQIPYLESRFLADSSNSTYCYNYLHALRNANLPYGWVVSAYMKTKTENQLLTAENWSILALGVTDVDSDPYHFIVKNRAPYSSLLSPARVERKIVITAAQSLEALAELKDTVSFYRQQTYLASLHDYRLDSVRYLESMLLYRLLGCWGAYAHTAEAGLPEYAWKQVSEIEQTGRDFLKNIADTSLLRMAGAWVDHALHLEPDYANLLLDARLYEKAGNYMLARQKATDAKNMAEQYHWDAGEAEHLLQELH